MKKVWMSVFVVMLVLLLAMLCGCQKEKLETGKDNGTSCANIIMGGGSFAHRNGFLYFGDLTNIYEYDMETEKTTFFPVKPNFPMYLHVTENHVVYCGTGGIFPIYATTRDGKVTETLFEGCMEVYIDEDNAYYRSAHNMHLYRRSITEGTETLLLENVQRYFWTEDAIYAIKKENNKFILLMSNPEETAFEQIQLSFEPIELFVAGEDLYMSQLGTYQVVRYHEGKETQLPIRSLKYQMLDGNLIFADEESYDNSTWTYKSYDLETGDIKTLCESAMEFGVFESRITFWCRGENGSWWMLYDWESNQLKQLYPKAE